MSTWVPIPALFLMIPDIAGNREALSYLWSQRRDGLLQPRCLPLSPAPPVKPTLPSTTQSHSGQATPISS